MTPPPEKCEPTKWQSKQKHAFLEAYFRLWPENVARDPNKGGPSLSIVDLHAAWGWCYDEETKKTWEGTAVLAARCLRMYHTRWRKTLVASTYHPDRDILPVQAEALREALAAERVPDGTMDVAILSEPLEPALDSALRAVNPRFPSIWILDPYQPEDLPWEVVERVAGHEGTYENARGQTIIRRPELFINLMTQSLQRNFERNPHLVDVAFGMSEAEWRPAMEAYQSEEMNVRDALINVYLDRLEEFYEKRPQVMLVKGAEGAIVYAVVFCSNHNAGYYANLKVATPKYQEWFEGKWKRPAREVATTRRERRKVEKAGHKFTRLDEGPWGGDTA